MYSYADIHAYRLPGWTAMHPHAYPYMSPRLAWMHAYEYSYRHTY